MTKTLTEQWKDGELPEGEYFAITTWSDEIRPLSFYGDCFLDTEVPLDNSVIVEVLAPVPSYDEIKRLQEQLKEANEVIKKFEKTEIGHKQKDGTYMLTVCGVIIDLEKRPTSALVQEETYFYDPRPLTKYLKKWGVK